MSNFTSPLHLSPSGKLWATSRLLTFEIGIKGSGLVITVPEGTLTDLASIPRLLWPLMQPHSPKFAAAYVLHDHLCRWQDFDRATADAILRNALIALGANQTYAGLIYAAVSFYRITTRN